MQPIWTLCWRPLELSVRYCYMNAAHRSRKTCKQQHIQEFFFFFLLGSLTSLTSWFLKDISKNYSATTMSILKKIYCYLQGISQATHACMCVCMQDHLHIALGAGNQTTGWKGVVVGGKEAPGPTWLGTWPGLKSTRVVKEGRGPPVPWC